MDRRELVQSLPLLTLLPSLAAGTGEAQVSAQKGPYVQQTCKEPLLTECRAFPYEGLPTRRSEDGAVTRQIMEGQIPGLPIIEIHETTLEAGAMPHAAHRHPHAELLLVRTGTIEFQSDAPPTRVTAGGMAYCAPDKLHGFRNIGDGPAEYFIVKIGNESVCQK
jgi:quercetin dioxygenase-like cupin family protein